MQHMLAGMPSARLSLPLFALTCRARSGALGSCTSAHVRAVQPGKPLVPPAPPAPAPAPAPDAWALPCRQEMRHFARCRPAAKRWPCTCWLPVNPEWTSSHCIHFPCSTCPACVLSLFVPGDSSLADRPPTCPLACLSAAGCVGVSDGPAGRPAAPQDTVSCWTKGEGERRAGR